jgi:hypothetical protein
MSNRNGGDDWIHKARIELYEKTKNMSNEELQDYFRKSREEAVKQYGLTIAYHLEPQHPRKIHKK